jgi:hypothetical protein
MKFSEAVHVIPVTRMVPFVHSERRSAYGKYITYQKESHEASETGIKGLSGQRNLSLSGWPAQQSQSYCESLYYRRRLWIYAGLHAG